VEPGVPCPFGLICGLGIILGGGFIAVALRVEETIVEYEVLWLKVSYGIAINMIDSKGVYSDEEDDDHDFLRERLPNLQC